MIQKEADTYWAKIFIAGPIEVAKQVIRLRAKKQGMCVTIEPTTYMYSGGEEEGYVIGLINYPRFPASPSAIWNQAMELGKELREQTGQDSFTVQAPDRTLWISDRQ